MKVGLAALGVTLAAGVVTAALARHDGLEYFGTSAVVAATFVMAAIWTYAIGGVARRADRLLGALLVGGAWSVAAYLLFLGLAGFLYAERAPFATVAVALAGVGHVPALTLFVLVGLAARHQLGHTRGTRSLVVVTLSLGLTTAVGLVLVGEPGPPFDGVAGPLTGVAWLGPVVGISNILWLALQLVAPVLLWRARRSSAGLPRLRAAAVASLVPLCVVTFCSLGGLAAPDSQPGVGAIILLAGMAAAWPLTAAGYSLAVRDPGTATVLTASVLARVGGLLIGLLAAMTALSVVLVLSLGTGVGSTLVVAVITLLTAAVLRPVGARVHAALVGGAAVGASVAPPPAVPHAAAPVNGHPVSAPVNGHVRPVVAPAPLERLSSREREVLALLAAGRSNAGIAAELVLSQRTVDAHLRSIFTKLDLPDGQHDNRRVRAALVWAQAGRPGETSH